MNAIAKLTDFQPLDFDEKKTIAAICKKRDVALDLLGKVFDLYGAANDTLREITPDNKYGRLSDKITSLLGDKTDRRPNYLEQCRREVDAAVWEHLIYRSSLTRLMDTKARDDFYRQLQNDPAPATPENCAATMMQLVGDAENIFKRGLIEAFRALNWSYKSNDVFRIKHRFVMAYARSSEKWDRGPSYDHRGCSWNYSGQARERLSDVERCFAILDGHTIFGHATIVAAIDAAAGRHEYQAENEYFRCKWYRNGNMHVHFLRRDLVKRANQIIAERYGKVLPDASGTDSSLKHAARQKHAVDLGDFPTPNDVAQLVINKAMLKRGQRVLEPSAGDGNLAKLAAGVVGDGVDCIDIAAKHVAVLAAEGIYNLVRHGDFLEQNAFPQYDRVVMNPPFAKRADVRHVYHASRFLKRGGRLVAIMPASVKYRRDKLAIDFRAFIDRHNGTIEDLPHGSFTEAGTNVATVIIAFNV